MRNIRVRLIPLHELSPATQARIEREYQHKFDALTARGVSFEKATEIALKATGCERMGDDGHVSLRAGFDCDGSKRQIEAIRPGVVRRVA
jgi:hypothetical protein